MEGDYHFLRYVTTLVERDELIHQIMIDISKTVYITKMPWDPFNIKLVVKAQPEPKLESFHVL
jgi:hypothetical protein